MPTQLILMEDVYKLGEAGDLVRVKDGYARNYLIPKGKAMLATSGRVAEIEHKKRVVDEKVKRDVAEFQTRGKALAKIALRFERQAGPEGKLFGSVTSSDIQHALTDEGFQLDRRKILLDDTIKETGEHAFKVRLHREVVVDLTLQVVGVGGPEPEADTDAADEGDAEGAEARAADDAEHEEDAEADA